MLRVLGAVLLASVLWTSSAIADTAAYEPPYDDASTHQSCNVLLHSGGNVCINGASADRLTGRLEASAGTNPGLLTVAPSASADASVLVEHAIAAPVEEVVITVDLHVNGAQISRNPLSLLVADVYGYSSAAVTASSVGMHDTCWSCGGFGGGWSLSSTTGSQTAQAQDVTLEVRMRNFQGGDVPPGTMTIVVNLGAQVSGPAALGPVTASGVATVRSVTVA